MSDAAIPQANHRPAAEGAPTEPFPRPGATRSWARWSDPEREDWAAGPRSGADAAAAFAKALAEHPGLEGVRIDCDFEDGRVTCATRWLLGRAPDKSTPEGAAISQSADDALLRALSLLKECREWRSNFHFLPAALSTPAAVAQALNLSSAVAWMEAQELRASLPPKAGKTHEAASKPRI